MGYVCLNDFHKVRTDGRAMRRRAAHLDAGDRYEFRESLHGFIYEVVDHERMVFYRQDRPVFNQGDLFEGFLPFMCDYCKQVVYSTYLVPYRLKFEMLTRPFTDRPEWKSSYLDIKFSCCNACHNGPLPIPEKLIGHHLTELQQDGRAIFTQKRKL
ncbi:hypothetical protein GZH47_33480 (plasmid) [Paenibacillus rhizovicinus]|uniref:Uncharacterized protein n=1 Tax=Paenibacillus rhizovicinus TaxID=2704463 RepID=A0A6C0PBH3_9BACL|nr:hypothetical protein [Paenibacillus rhizovicinus]QHW35806.1 hypothetical protein GZH47_33480 [Paenibacillus rhizovicinus]